MKTIETLKKSCKNMSSNSKSIHIANLIQDKTINKISLNKQNGGKKKQIFRKK